MVGLSKLSGTALLNSICSCLANRQNVDKGNVRLFIVFLGPLTCSTFDLLTIFLIIRSRLRGDSSNAVSTSRLRGFVESLLTLKYCPYLRLIYLVDLPHQWSITFIVGGEIFSKFSITNNLFCRSMSNTKSVILTVYGTEYSIIDSTVYSTICNKKKFQSSSIQVVIFTK